MKEKSAKEYKVASNEKIGRGISEINSCWNFVLTEMFIVITILLNRNSCSFILFLAIKNVVKRHKFQFKKMVRKINILA